jgi:hypothetical protein
MKKHGISKSVKQQEAAIVRKAADEKGIGSTEMAELIGREQTAISQWFVANPTAIPDFYWVKLAALLEFDPSITRPWLKEMWLDFNKIWGRTETASGVVHLIDAATSKLSAKELLKLAGRLEAMADLRGCQ